MRGSCLTYRVLAAAILALGLDFSAMAGLLQPLSVRNASLPQAQGGNGDSGPAVVSGDGAYVLFSSAANNLATLGSTNPVPVLLPAHVNVYLRNRTNAATMLVSVNAAGSGGGNGDSFAVGISTNGEYALFESSASDLVAGDTNNAVDVFVRDLVHGTNILVSVGTNGGFGNGNSGSAVMTPDGRYVAFVSTASNLVVNDNNGIPDVFVRDLWKGTTTLASPGAKSAGVQAASTCADPMISDDGRFVAFYSTATNLPAGNVWTNAGIYVRDMAAQTTCWASSAALDQLKAVFGTTNAVCFSPRLSADGSYVAYEVSVTAYAKTSGVVLRYNLVSGQTDVVNNNANAPKTAYEDIRTLDMSPDGRFVATVANTDSQGLNTVICLWDAQVGTNLLVSTNSSSAAAVSGSSYAPMVDAGGTHVAFLSSSTNLTTNVLNGDIHLYYSDIQAGTTVLLDADTNGIGLGVDPQTFPSLSTDDRFLTFQSAGASDRNRCWNSMICDLRSDAVELISTRHPALGCQTADGPSVLGANPVSLDGRYVAFASDADDLVTDDQNGYRDVFVRDLALGTNLLVSVDTNGWAAAGSSAEASISDDGRYVVFSSSASSLVPGDTNNAQDVFIRDLQSSTTTLVSVNLDGAGQGNASSYSPVLSRDGRFVMFRSLAQNLASGSFSSGVENLFVRDLQLGVTYALTTATSSTKVASAVMTPDGRYVAFIGPVDGNTSSYLYVWSSLSAQRVYTNTTSSLAQVAISPDGQRLLFTTPTGYYLADRSNPANNALVAGDSFAAYAPQPVGNFSADGTLLLYSTYLAPVLGIRAVCLYDLQAKTNGWISRSCFDTSPADLLSDWSVMSADNRLIIYRSYADNLVPGDSNGVADIFLYDRASGTTTLLTANQAGNRSGANGSSTPVLSGDGRTLVFQSAAPDLVPGDENRTGDVFVCNLFTSGMIPGFRVQIVPGAASSRGATLTWPALPGKTYRVQYKDHLTDAQWLPLAGNITILGGTAFFTNSATMTGQRFYQIQGF